MQNDNSLNLNEDVDPVYKGGTGTTASEQTAEQSFGHSVLEDKAMLASVLAMADDAIIAKDLDGFVTSWNPAAERIFGYTATEMIGSSITKLIPADRVQEEAHILPAVSSGHKIENFTTHRLTKDGALIAVLLNVAPIKDVNGNIIGICKIAKDISEVKKVTEKSLMLGAIIDSTDDAIISKNLNGIITSWNPSAQRIFGYLPEEIIGHSVLKLIPADRQDEETLILSRLRRGERVDYFHTKRLNKSGRLIDVSLTISPVKDEHGNIIGVSKIARDITDLIVAEKQGAMLSAIVSHSDDAIISKDFNSIVTSWNNSAERLFGYTADEMIGQSIVKLIPADRQQEEPDIIAKIRAGERVDHFETKRLAKNGKLLDVSLTISPVIDITGRIIGISKIARDITDKKLEEQRKNDFIAIVSHELKTPLTSMRSYVQLALRKISAEGETKVVDLLQRADLQTKRMTVLIQDFLNLSRLEEGRMSLDISEFSMSDLIEEIIADLKAIHQTHVINCQPTAEIMLSADRQKIGQVLTNLIENAIKYSPSGTTVTVNCSVIDKEVNLSITDEGCGISKADQVRLFERFYRIDDARIQGVSGFGIGLYLVSELLKLHGSKISVTSEIDKGSTFSFNLPFQ
ncbi:MAG: PAS domain S-box protein [Chitinophagaceae bacterium]|nr:MAG: PAS domain S-box protein [Chitinophagaceae bacterium]